MHIGADFNVREMLDNLPRSCLGTQPTSACKYKHARTCTHSVPPPSALSGTSLNIHHSGCSESAVNAASHSRESLKPTLSSALPSSPLFLPLALSSARARTHSFSHSLSHGQAHVQKKNTLEGTTCGISGRTVACRNLNRAHARCEQICAIVFAGTPSLSRVLFQETGCLIVWVSFCS